MKDKLLVIPVFVPHQGCPHDCCFCNQKIISGQTKAPTMQDVVDTINKFKEAAPRYSTVQLAFFGGSFTAIEAEKQELYLKTAFPYLKQNGGFIDSFRLSTRPDAIDDETLQRLKKYGVEVVELGAQSMVDSVLANTERGHTAEDTGRASKMLKEAGFVLGIQTMPGLPGATIEDDIKTCDEVIKLKPDLVRIYPTLVVKQTKLYRDYLEGKYTPMPLETAVDLCAYLYGRYTAAGIDVARIGLQSTDTISSKEGSDVAAGPCHNAFGNLVKSKIFYNGAEALLNNYFSENKEETVLDSLTVYVRKEKIPEAVGQDKINENRFIERFGFKRVFFRENKEAVGTPWVNSKIAYVNRNSENKLGDKVLRVEIWM